MMITGLLGSTQEELSVVQSHETPMNSGRQSHRPSIQLPWSTDREGKRGKEGEGEMEGGREEGRESEREN